MIRNKFLIACLMASAATFTVPAYAQTAEKEAEPPADAPSPDDPSLLTVSPQDMNVAAADQRAELLEAQIASLQAQLDELKKALPKATPSWKGAPQWSDADGWSFKVRGRMMLDAAYTGRPDNYVANRNFGFNSRVRRIRLGVEGAIPGGFAYKAEADFANSTVGFGDVTLSYAPANKPFSLTIGNFETSGRVPMDPLNIESVEISRGPNAAIFGIGTGDSAEQAARAVDAALVELLDLEHYLDGEDFADDFAKVVTQFAAQHQSFSNLILGCNAREPSVCFALCEQLLVPAVGVHEELVLKEVPTNLHRQRQGRAPGAQSSAPAAQRHSKCRVDGD